MHKGVALVYEGCGTSLGIFVPRVSTPVPQPIASIYEILLF